MASNLTPEEADEIKRMHGFVGHSLLALIRIVTSNGGSLRLPPESIVQACDRHALDIAWSQDEQMYVFAAVPQARSLCPFYPDLHETVN